MGACTDIGGCAWDCSSVVEVVVDELDLSRGGLNADLFIRLVVNSAPFFGILNPCALFRRAAVSYVVVAPATLLGCESVSMSSITEKPAASITIYTRSSWSIYWLGFI